jgi:phospholipid N-methyltransferase
LEAPLITKKYFATLDDYLDKFKFLQAVTSAPEQLGTVLTTGSVTIKKKHSSIESARKKGASTEK